MNKVLKITSGVSRESAFSIEGPAVYLKSEISGFGPEHETELKTTWIKSQVA